MKNALILHGTKNTPNSNWQPWLKNELENLGYSVWIPQLPESDKPNIDKYNELLLNSEFNYNSQTILIGHSSGAVAILGLLQSLPENTIVNSCYLIGSFKNNSFLNWDALDGLFLKPFDFESIKSKSKKFIFIHSDNDPYCPLEHAEFLNNQLNGQLIILPGQKHFSINTTGEKYKEFPELLELITKND